MLTVGKLRKLLADLPDDMPVVVDGDDHSYWRAQATDTQAHEHPDSSPYEPPYSQYGGEDEETIRIYGPIKRVFWVGV